MLSANLRCVAISQENGAELHVATLLDSGSEIGDAEFGLARSRIKIVVHPEKLVVGRTYRIMIEEVSGVVETGNAK
jgi:hypothetical protein